MRLQTAQEPVVQIAIEEIREALAAMRGGELDRLAERCGLSRGTVYRLRRLGVPASTPFATVERLCVGLFGDG